MVNVNARMKIDAWYKLVAVFGMILSVLVITIQPTFVSSLDLLVLGLGMFFAGIGEWKNQYCVLQFIEASILNPFMQLKIPVRKNTAVGTILILVGAGLILWSMKSILGIDLLVL